MIDSRVPWHEYLATAALNISSLKELARSPLHYLYRLEHGRDSDALTLGRAAHCATLEPDRYPTSYAVWTSRKNNGDMAQRKGPHWDAFVTAHQHQTILTPEQHGLACMIAGAVRSDPTAAKYLETGDAEVTMTWEMHGRRCKGRPDWITILDGFPVIVGLKTCRDVRPFKVGNASANLGYHMQWAWYRDGYSILKGRTPRVVEIFVESQPPHAVATYIIGADVIEQGRDDYMKLLERLKECEQDNDWPGPTEGEQEMSLPTWAYGEQDSDLSDLGLVGE